MRRDIYKFVQVLLILLIFIAGLFVSFHIIKKILGGSLEMEDIILGLVIFNISCTFALVFNLAQLKSDNDHLSRQFYCLAKDFKEQVAEKND